MNLEQLKTALREAGVVGAGGAGFPTYAKLSEKADTLILNCAECEPLLRLHRQVLKLYTYEILSTLYEISKLTGIKDIIIGIKASYKETVDAINSQISSFENMRVCTLPEIYPAGDEVVLTYEALRAEWMGKSYGKIMYAMLGGVFVFFSIICYLVRLA